MLYHLYSPVLIYLIPTASISAVGPSCLLQPRLQQSVPNIPVSFCYIRLIQPDNPTDCSSLIPSVLEQSVGDNSLIQLWYHTCIRPEGATGCNKSVAFLRVYFTLMARVLETYMVLAWCNFNIIDLRCSNISSCCSFIPCSANLRNIWERPSFSHFTYSAFWPWLLRWRINWRSWRLRRER